MPSQSRNEDEARHVAEESYERKSRNRRDRRVRESRLTHQYEHDVAYRRRRLESFRADLDTIKDSGNREVFERVKRGITNCYRERHRNPSKFAEWQLYEAELEDRGLQHLLPSETD